MIVEVGGFQYLFLQKAGNDIEYNGEKNRYQDRTCDRKIERPILPFDADVTGQASQRDAELRGEIHASADEEEGDSPDHEITGDGFHVLEFQRLKVCMLAG